MKTAIIGLGPHGKRLLKIVERMKELELAGLVDRNEEVLTSLEGISASKKFTETSKLHDNIPDLKVLLIATNGPSHAPLALEAVEKGIPYILVEKPMACSVKDCQAMIEAAEKKKIRIAVNKKNRHDPVYQYFKKKLDEGAWGKLRNIYIQIPGIGLGCVATHWMDMANYLVGRAPERIVGWVDEPKLSNPRGLQFIDPGGLVICDYGKGVRALINQIEDGAGPITMEMHTTSIRLFFDPKNAHLEILERDLSIIPGPGRPPVYEPIAYPDDLNLKGNMLDQMEGVLRELIGKDDMLTDAKHGSVAIEMLVATYISQQQGHIPISLPLRNSEDLEIFLPVT